MKKIVLAYSGGLDTSVIVKWLKETYDAEIVTFAADIGQEEELRGLPPVHIDVGSLDGFLDEDVAFVARLAKADVAVDLVVTPGASHGSEHLNADAATSRRILAARRAARERALVGG